MYYYDFQRQSAVDSRTYITGKIFFPGCQERIKTVIALLSLASMKLLRVHMAAQGNATIILLVALLGIWLKCRSKIHTDKPKKNKNKQMHFTLLQMAEGMKCLHLTGKHKFVFSPKWIIKQS